MSWRTLLLLLLGSGLALADTAPDYTFSLLPTDGVIAGPAGTELGWGYEITNPDSVKWLETLSLNAGSFTGATPSSLFDFPVVAPLSTVTVAFDPLAATGLYEVLWDGSTAAGTTAEGDFTLSALWFDGNPDLGGSLIGAANDQLTSYSVTLTPEPLTALLMFSGLAAVLGRRKSGYIC